MKVRSRAAGCSAQVPRDRSVSAGFESGCAMYPVLGRNAMMVTEVHNAAGVKESAFVEQ
jgi:hypothetical protein